MIRLNQRLSGVITYSVAAVAFMCRPAAGVTHAPRVTHAPAAVHLRGQSGVKYLIQSHHALMTPAGPNRNTRLLCVKVALRGRVTSC